MNKRYILSAVAAAIMVASATSGIAATVIPLDASWIAGVTLQNAKVPLGHIGIWPVYALTATCRPEVLTGGTSSIDIYYTASGTGCASGTKINTTSCNGNSGALALQNMGVTNLVVPANSDICAVFSNDAAWSGTTSTGNIQLQFVQP
jgi:hypothetical protein